MSSESYIRKHSTKSTRPRRPASTSESSAPPTPTIQKHSMKRSSSESVRKSISDNRKSKSDSKINKHADNSRKASLSKPVSNLDVAQTVTASDVEDSSLVQLQKCLAMEDNWR